MTPWLRRLFGRDESDDLADETRAHIAERIDDLVESGLPEEEARRRAHREFGNRTLAVEDARAVWTLRRLCERRAQDLRDTLRTLTGNPGLSAAIVLSIALGIGANTAIFSILNGLVLKSLPVPRADRLVQVAPGGEFGSWTHPLWEQLRDNQDVLEGVFACSTRLARFNLSSGGAADLANGLWVSGRFFEVLGITPVIGRTFVAADDTRGGGPDGPVAVISYGFWHRRFGGAPGAIGRPLMIEGIPFTVVGVAPPGFLGVDVGSAFDIAIPIGTQPLVLRRNRLDQRSWWWLTVMGRLKSRQTAPAAAAAFAPLQAVLRERTRPQDVRPDEAAAYLSTPMTVSPARGGTSFLREDYEPALAALMGIVGLILLIACVNVANLLLARAERRRRDVSLRLALGASRSRLVSRALVESLCLSALGAAAGVAMATSGSRWLVAQIPAAGGAPSLDLSLDWRVLVFTGAIAVAVALIFGTIPALYASSVSPLQAMRAPRSMHAGHGRIGAALVAFQVALCLVLVVGAGLFVRTFTLLAGRDAGLDRDRVLVIDVDARRTARGVRGPALYRRIVDAVRALPGVAAASFSSVTPASGNAWDTLIDNPRGLSLPEDERRVYRNDVGPDWFATYGIPFTAGRDFNATDQSEHPAVAIVNEAFARRYLAGRSPIGETIREVGVPQEPAISLTIVGLVKDAVYLSPREDPMPTMFVPALSGSMLSVRAGTSAPGDLIPAVTSALANVDGSLTLTPRALASYFEAVVARERILALLAGAFGALALLLSAIGLYGVVSYRVGAQRAEIGIRMALGASRFRVVGLVIRQVAVLMLVGVLLGIPAGIWSARSVSALLFGLRPYDPATYLAAVATLLVVSAAAAWAPARRAAATNPALTLRAE